MDQQSKRGARITVEQQVELITSDGHLLPVTLRDISKDGFKIEHRGADLLVGEIVIIRTGRSDSRAQLQWVTEKEAGAAFLDASGVAIDR